MNLQDYYRRKRRRATAYKIAILVFVLALAAAFWKFLWVPYLSTKNVKITWFADGKNAEILPPSPKFIFCKEMGCFYVDGAGILGDTAPNFSENPLPELVLKEKFDIKIGERALEESTAKIIGDFLNGLKNFGAEPSRVEIAGRDLKTTLKEGWHILISLDMSLEETIGNFKLLLDQKIKEKRKDLEYIDLRFPNKAFYKLRN